MKIENLPLLRGFARGHLGEKLGRLWTWVGQADVIYPINKFYLRCHNCEGTLSASISDFNTRLTYLSVNLSSGVVDCVGNILPASDMPFIPNSRSMWPFGA
jgi:hypothetical protein